MPPVPLSSVAVYVFTPQGFALAEKLAARLPVTIFARSGLIPACRAGHARPGAHCFDALGPLLERSFTGFGCHIFIAACGIAVRAVAPLLAGKDRDPAVLVMDQQGRHVISLLSGHLGGANAMAARVAALIGATPVITTATDVEGLPALDVLAAERGMAIAELGAVKLVSAALLRGETVFLDDPPDRLGLAQSAWESLFAREERAVSPAGCRVVVSERKGDPAHPDTLYLHPRTLACGVGCKKDVPARDILEAIERMLEETGYAPASLACLASLDAKQDEAGLLEAARLLGLPVRFFSAWELAAHPPQNPSPKALERFGVAGVCESAALAAVAQNGDIPALLAPKRAQKGTTVALAGPAALLP